MHGSEYMEVNAWKEIQNNAMENVFYIGGSVCSGKTTLAEELCVTYGCRHFSIDDRLGEYAQKGIEDGKTICQKHRDMTPEEFWMRDPAKQSSELLLFYREIFPYVMDDIRQYAAQTEGILIAEGIALLPESMHGEGICPSSYFCLTAGPAYQVSRYRERDWVRLLLTGCSDEEAAFARWMERDICFAQEVRRQCEKAGYEGFCILSSEDEGDSVLETFGKLLEILLVEEDFVFVVSESPVPLLATLAFGDGKIKVVVAFCSLHIEEVGSLAGTDRFRVDVFGVSLLGVRPFIIFTVHGLVLLHFFYKCREII